MHAIAACLAAGLLFCGAWLALHPPLPQHPTGDVFTALATARHLSRGDGLLNDSIYPLFTAYRWGSDVPQPLLHRGPGLAALLLPAWWLSGGDPVRAETLVRPVMLCLLGLLVALGVWGLRRHDSPAAAGAWALLLLLNPLLALAASWGWSEVPSSLLLLALWLLLRKRAPGSLSPSAAAGFAALSALLALVRLDLLWIPAFWWIAISLARCQSRHPGTRPKLLRRTALAVCVFTAMLAPWWTHVARHGGSPFVNPLADAVQLDLAEGWWDYPLLRARSPMPLPRNLAENTGPALRKVRGGVRQYVENLGRWFPWTAWLGLAVLWGLQTRRRLRRGHRPVMAAGPPVLLVATLGLLMLQYSFLSAMEIRHMLPVAPLFAWEACLIAGRIRCRPQRRFAGPHQRPKGSSWPRRSALRAALLLAVAAAALAVTPPGLGGEASNVEHARRSVDHVAAVTAAGMRLPPGPVFSDSAIVPWRLDRAYVWSPLDQAIEAEIRLAVPAMRDAPYLRLQPPPRFDD